MGITRTALKWFFNYLQGRAQTVKSTNGTPMGYRPIAAGVPQGSVLVPLLFGLFILDLPTVLKHCECTQYADNTHIYLHSCPSDLNKAITLIEEDAQAAAVWVLRNILELNARKTKAMIVGIHAIHCLH